MSLHSAQSICSLRRQHMEYHYAVYRRRTRSTFESIDIAKGAEHVTSLCASHMCTRHRDEARRRYTRLSLVPARACHSLITSHCSSPYLLRFCSAVCSSRWAASARHFDLAHRRRRRDFPPSYVPPLSVPRPIPRTHPIVSPPDRTPPQPCSKKKSIDTMLPPRHRCRLRQNNSR
jgi:hypothetical protein